MTKYKNYFFKVVLVGILSIVMGLSISVNADAGTNQSANYDNSLEAVAIIENLSTGGKQYYELSSVSNCEQYSTNENSLTARYEVFIPIETPFDTLLSTNLLDTESGGNNTHGVKAKLNVVYQVDSTGEEVKAQKVYGSWTPNSTLYYLTNRYVMLHSGSTPAGKKLERYPNKNKFEYVTNWGYNFRVWGEARPRAISEAIIHVSGMSSTYKITVNLPYS